MLEENELDSMYGLSDEELTRRFREAVRIENEIKRIKAYLLQNMISKRNFLI